MPISHIGRGRLAPCRERAERAEISPPGCRFRIAVQYLLCAFDQLKAEDYLETAIDSGTYLVASIPEELLAVGVSLTERLAGLEWEYAAVQQTRKEDYYERESE
jgi:hypothetical protein